jgi:hypothetical protein
MGAIANQANRRLPPREIELNEDGKPAERAQIEVHQGITHIGCPKTSPSAKFLGGAE